MYRVFTTTTQQSSGVSHFSTPRYYCTVSSTGIYFAAVALPPSPIVAGYVGGRGKGEGTGHVCLVFWSPYCKHVLYVMYYGGANPHCMRVRTHTPMFCSALYCNRKSIRIASLLHALSMQGTTTTERPDNQNPPSRAHRSYICCIVVGSLPVLEDPLCCPLYRHSCFSIAVVLSSVYPPRIKHK